MNWRLTADELELRAREAGELASPCRLCPRNCGVDRLSGEIGRCGSGSFAKIAAATAHYGEEPPLTVDGGAGTVFFSRCNMGCVYCQNNQISQGDIGSEISVEDLAREMLRLQTLGCANIEAVSPSHQLPWLLEALAVARRDGLDLPIVYNSNGYEAAHTLEVLEGVVDVYVPDIKYASDEHALRYSDAPGYVGIAQQAVATMHRQVGNLVVDLSGRAIRGLIIRLLVLPDGIAGIRETLMWIKDHLPSTVTLSIMAQYAPLHRAAEYPELNRTISEDEYEAVLEEAWEMGFENIYIQELTSSQCGIPDFSLNCPFSWEDTCPPGKR